LDSLFLDNNISIGFCFRQDPQHTFAKKLFNYNCSMNWSNNVLYEFKKVFERKRNAFDDLVFDLILELNNKNKYMSKNNLINISLRLQRESFDVESLKKLFTDFWAESSFQDSVSSSEIVSSLNRYKRTFIKQLLKDKSFCLKKISTHIRQQNYPIIEQQLNIDGEDDLNKLGNDMNICLDAHDLGKIVHKLKFITDDTKILEDKLNIENITKIYRVLGINDYEFPP